ncbi:uncharacterized protein PV09_09723 [Verruconis gallopava]|uniref:Uncharacterized protein n=1 Tax=Verruconis gallopava TaxID=253628 RepID=A0A0D1YCS1_9PEZI|nr:uncharacterized protein PV09_09723 [Verruconis gallopava]KIV98466.1 hypothetical protein PV09_09723 [Verruconis gallopava]
MTIEYIHQLLKEHEAKQKKSKNKKAQEGIKWEKDILDYLEVNDQLLEWRENVSHYDLAKRTDYLIPAAAHVRAEEVREGEDRCKPYQHRHSPFMDCRRFTDKDKDIFHSACTNCVFGNNAHRCTFYTGSVTERRNRRKEALEEQNIIPRQRRRFKQLLQTDTSDADALGVAQDIMLEGSDAPADIGYESEFATNRDVIGRVAQRRQSISTPSARCRRAGTVSSPIHSDRARTVEEEDDDDTPLAHRRAACVEIPSRRYSVQTIQTIEDDDNEGEDDTEDDEDDKDNEDDGKLWALHLARIDNAHL